MRKLIAGALLLSGLATTAGASVVYPVGYYDANQNGTIVAPGRSDPAAAFDGPANGTFYSLGIGGSVVFDFGQTVGGKGSVTEVTYRLAGYKEYANLYTSSNGVTWTLLTKSFNADAVDGEPLFAATPFRYLKFVDASPAGKGRDGFDIDSVSFAPVPLPAAGLALAAGLAGLATLRRRRG